MEFIVFFICGYNFYFLQMHCGKERELLTRLISSFMRVFGLSIFNGVQVEGRGTLGRISAIQFRGYEMEGRAVNTSCCQKLL